MGINNELYHYGIARRSGRYPYGSGNRPYQDREQSRSSSRKTSSLSRYISSRKQAKTEEKMKKEKAEVEKKEVDEAARKQQYESEKARVLKEGTATEVLKYQGDLTNQELQSAFTRLNLESQLKNLSSKEAKSAVDKVDTIMKTVKTGTEWVRIGTDTYNAIAAIYNASPEGREHPLTLIKKGG